MLDCNLSWDLAGLLVVRAWLLACTGWGFVVMVRLLRRGKQLDFPIVPPPLVKLTGAFLALCFAATLWITFTLFFGDPGVCHNGVGPVGVLSAWERTVYGTTIVYALSCALWIINLGLKGYRNGPRVDTAVLNAIVSGMAVNPMVDAHDEVEE